MDNCYPNKCGKDLKKALEKIKKDSYYKPTCCIGPTGPTGPQGISGQQTVRNAYLVTFNEGKMLSIPSKERLPINRVELDISNLINLDPLENTIQFNKTGYYFINIVISAYSPKTETEFDKTKDFVSFGFRKINTDNIYIGASEWSKDEVAKQITAHGIISVEDTANIYELVNTSKQNLNLESPSINDIASISYFTNSLVTITVEYLGSQGG